MRCSAGRAGRAGVSIRRRDLRPEDRVQVRDVGVTGKAVTVLETAAALDDGSAFLDRALKKQVMFADVLATYAGCREQITDDYRRLRDEVVIFIQPWPARPYQPDGKTRS